MICRRFLSFVFVVSLAFFSGLFITTQNSFATSVDCGSYNISTYHNNFSCDTSSLDSSVDWFYNFTFDIQGDFSSLSNTTLSVGFGRYNNATTNGNSAYGIIPSFSIRAVDTYLSYPFTLNDSRRVLSGNYNERIRDVYIPNLNWLSLSTSHSFSVVISDSFLPSACPDPPSGSFDITANGTYDVTNYASATVNVPAEVIQGDYHNDLVNIQKSIIVCGAVLLVLYFFYCIYRLIIKNSGVH